MSRWASFSISNVKEHSGSRSIVPSRTEDS
jgi:hypothetical protein